MTPIAKNGFDTTSTAVGKAIYTQSRNQKIANVKVRRYYKTSYDTWGFFSEFMNMVDCLR